MSNNKRGDLAKTIALVVCAILAVSLAATTVWFYTQNNNQQNQINNLQNDKATLQNQISILELEKSNLQTQLTELQESSITKDSQISDLQNQIQSKTSELTNLTYQLDTLNTQVTQLTAQLDNVKEPHLINYQVGASDHRENDEYYLEIYGQVFNLGYGLAYNTKIHVVAYYIDGTKAIDTRYDIGYVAGLDYFGPTYINKWIYYDGPMIDMNSVTITPEWTNTP
jgi:predicted nuclease with TOPRIM domain